jgi:RNA polymerase sigma factor (sigma-70 family)
MGTDADLIAAARAGNPAAFGTIVERYQRAVLAIAYSAARDRVLAEDIAQDAFLTAWSRIGELRDPERLPAWLCGITRNLARARRRTLHREQPGEVDAPADATPFEALDERQLDVALAGAIARVPEAYREPLVLFYGEQRSAKAVGRALGLSEAAVHQRLSRGRALLAGDAELVEHALERRRPRRDLAAAILAALAVGLGSSRVEATPRPRGRPMLKLAAITLATMLAGATTYVVAQAQTSGASSAAPAPGRTPATRSMAPASPPASSARRVVPLLHAPSSAPAGTALGSLAMTAPDCATVAQHMAEVMFEQPEPSDHPGSEEKLDHLTSLCTDQHWSDAYRSCVLGAADGYSIIFGCARFQIEGVLDNAPGSGSGSGHMLVLPSRTAAVAPTTDLTCAGLAAHAGVLTSPDPAALESALASQPETMRDAFRNALAKSATRMRTSVETTCNTTAWTEQHRHCVAAATTVELLLACE